MSPKLNPFKPIRIRVKFQLILVGRSRFSAFLLEPKRIRALINFRGILLPLLNNFPTKSLSGSPLILIILKNSKKLFKKLSPREIRILLASLIKSRLVKKKKTNLISKKILKSGLEILVSFLVYLS